MKIESAVKGGLTNLINLEEGEEIKLPVKTDCLVIGGGIAGMTASLGIADQGFHALLVEKGPELGGLLNRVSTISHDPLRFAHFPSSTLFPKTVI